MGSQLHSLEWSQWRDVNPRTRSCKSPCAQAFDDALTRLGYAKAMRKLPYWMIRLGASIALVLAILYLKPEPVVGHPPGILVAEIPKQTAYHAAPFDKDGYTITPQATFDIHARVLGKNLYSARDEGGDISPIDLLLGWKSLSDSAVLDQLTIKMRPRYYVWHTDNLPLPQDEINRSMANMHMVPATLLIEKKLRAVRVGDLVHITGSLVNLQGPNNFDKATSLTREDSGWGACEIIYVTDIAVYQQP